MNVRTGSGFVEVIECPHCKYLVYCNDMIYDEAGGLLFCRFCQAGIYAERGIIGGVKVEWAMTPTERVDAICDAMGRNYFARDNLEVRDILRDAIRADRGTATAFLKREVK